MLIASSGSVQATLGAWSYAEGFLAAFPRVFLGYKGLSSDSAHCRRANLAYSVLILPAVHMSCGGVFVTREILWSLCEGFSTFNNLYNLHYVITRKISPQKFRTTMYYSTTACK